MSAEAVSARCHAGPQSREPLVLTKSPVVVSNHICASHHFPFSDCYVLFSHTCQAYEVVQSSGSEFLCRKVIYNVNGNRPTHCQNKSSSVFPMFFFTIYLSHVSSPCRVQSTPTHAHARRRPTAPQFHSPVAGLSEEPPLGPHPHFRGPAH